MEILGEIQAQVVYGKQCKLVPHFGGYKRLRQSLFGHDWIEHIHLYWQKIGIIAVDRKALNSSVQSMPPFSMMNCIGRIVPYWRF